MFFKKKSRYKNLPKHLAFIMDGNGRWATRRGLPRTFGHREGVKAMRRVVSACLEKGIEVVTFFVFSTENWKRPKEEVDYIFKLASEFSSNEVDEYVAKGIKLMTIGNLEAIPSETKEIIEKLVSKTKKCDKMIVNLAVNYGGREDILNACKKLSESDLEINQKNFRNFLYTKDLPEPDMVIRTSGEQRISNFLLYQMAYSEILFMKQYWPDFNSKSVDYILNEYQKRTRRFGGLKGDN